jgi:hypothetical protein
MEQVVREFVQDIAQDLAGLEVALYFQANPRAFDTPAGIALRTHRSVEQVQPALERLGEKGVLEEFDRGDGRYRCYALSPTRDTWALLCMVSEAYHDDPESRQVIVKMLIERHMRNRVAIGGAGKESGPDA